MGPHRSCAKLVIESAEHVLEALTPPSCVQQQERASGSSWGLYEINDELVAPTYELRTESDVHASALEFGTHGRSALIHQGPVEAESNASVRSIGQWERHTSQRR
jgi:hypothetical protein